ncbi:MAG: DNA/RNA nuclease SfsA [Celeribacter sp.]|jgi:sugar fermentation stimulation protein A
MRFPTPLIPARLLRRYKRFLADVIPETGPDAGREVTVHCPNPGAMLGLADPGARIWIAPTPDPKRKLPYGWRLVELSNGHMAGIDTSLTNRVVAEALAARAIPTLSAYEHIRSEARYAERSRVDFLLSGTDLQDAYVEVKSVTLRRNGDCAEFPDCVTARGARHLADLAQMVSEGHRAVMLYVVQRDDCARLRMASDLDPVYARAFDTARAAGVEMLCHAARLDPTGITLDGPLPIALDHARS